MTCTSNWMQRWSSAQPIYYHQEKKYFRWSAGLPVDTQEDETRRLQKKALPPSFRGCKELHELYCWNNSRVTKQKTNSYHWRTILWKFWKKECQLLHWRLLYSCSHFRCPAKMQESRLTPISFWKSHQMRMKWTSLKITGIEWKKIESFQCGKRGQYLDLPLTADKFLHVHIVKLFKTVFYQTYAFSFDSGYKMTNSWVSRDVFLQRTFKISYDL